MLMVTSFTACSGSSNLSFWLLVKFVHSVVKQPILYQKVNYFIILTYVDINSRDSKTDI